MGKISEVTQPHYRNQYSYISFSLSFFTLSHTNLLSHLGSLDCTSCQSTWESDIDTSLPVDCQWLIILRPCPLSFTCLIKFHLNKIHIQWNTQISSVIYIHLTNIHITISNTIINPRKHFLCFLLEFLCSILNISFYIHDLSPSWNNFCIWCEVEVKVLFSFSTYLNNL